MKLSNCSGSEPQSGEDGIGVRLFGLPLDPFLNPGQPLGGLMDVVAFDDVDEGFEQLLEAFASGGGRRGDWRASPASRRVDHGPQFLDLSHLMAIPRGALAPVAEAGNSTLSQQLYVAG